MVKKRDLLIGFRALVRLVCKKKAVLCAARRREDVKKQTVNVKSVKILKYD